jgi:hypothetical protein
LRLVAPAPRLEPEPGERVLPPPLEREVPPVELREAALDDRELLLREPEPEPEADFAPEPDFDPEPELLERLRERLAVERFTSLLKRLSSPPLVVSWYRKASLLSSNALNHSSQEIGCRLSSPLQPGKSMRIMPGSLPPPVPLTHAGVPPRSSTHFRMNS